MDQKTRQMLGGTLLVAVLAGCSATRGGSATSNTAASGAASTGAGPGMTAQGVVTNSELIGTGQGKTVQGINDWEGEVTGKPFPGAKFSKLKIGMSREQVDALIGKPGDESAYISGKAFIPFYFGSDRVRTQATYKGQGRLVFAHDGGMSGNDSYLTWIIYCPTEPGSV